MSLGEKQAEFRAHQKSSCGKLENGQTPGAGQEVRREAIYRSPGLRQDAEVRKGFVECLAACAILAAAWEYVDGFVADILSVPRHDHDDDAPRKIQGFNE